MKTCMIYGDLASDSAAENYPTVPICDECVAADQAQKEESQIVNVGPFDPSLGDECEFCGKTKEDEESE